MTVFFGIWALLAVFPVILGIVFLIIDLCDSSPSRKDVKIDGLILLGALLLPVTVVAGALYLGRRGYYVIRYDSVPPKTRWGF